MKDNFRQIVATSLLWAIWGSVFFVLEVLIREAGGPGKSIPTLAFTYLMPPVIFGLPFAWAEDRLFHRRLSIKWQKIFFVRVLIYCCAIYVIYYFIRTAVSYLDPGFVTGRWFEFKFMVIWGLMMIIYLPFKNVISHFDLRTIRSWVIGDYYNPVEEDRIFLFIDMNDSTPIAEKMGSRKYFEFLNDFHVEVDKAISLHEGEVFQYVGDEVVVTWKTLQGLKNNNAIEAFFTLKNRLEQSKQVFLDKYGKSPSIKAALHIGEVTKGELGKTRKDFAFVGDVLNTTARMYRICKECDASLVISRRLLRMFHDHQAYSPVSFGYFKPVGKEEQIFVYSLSK